MTIKMRKPPGAAGPRGRAAQQARTTRQPRRPLRRSLRHAAAALTAVSLLIAAMTAASSPASAADGNSPAAAPPPEQSNPVYQSLVNPAEGSPVRLPPPRFSADQTAQQQRRELEQAAGQRYSVDQLLRPSVLAPHVLQMERQPLADQAATRQRVRVVFALRGDLERFGERAFLDSLLGGDPQAQTEKHAADNADAAAAGDWRPLTAAELQAAGITPAAGNSPPGPANAADAPEAAAWGQEHYRLVHGELFSRIRFSGVIRSYASRSDDAVLLALRLDERFAQSPELRSRWQRLQRNEAGQLQVVETGPGPQGGAYVKVSRLREAPEMLLFEAELVLLEPTAWFGGANLLGSKLPPAIQSQVRDLRRAALRALR